MFGVGFLQRHITKQWDQEGLDTGDPLAFKSYVEFYDAYKKQLNARIDFHCKRRMENFELSYMIAPDPLMSSITDNCIEKGKDISQDGAKYIFHLIILTGLSNTVDSLAVVKKLVFEDKTVSMDELISAMKSDWKGYEQLRAQVLNRVPKFGNDEDYIDDIATQLMQDFEDKVQEWNRKQGTMMFPVSVGTFENYAVLGRDTAASPDGRFAKGPLAPNYSPTPGADITGPTAIVFVF